MKEKFDLKSLQEQANKALEAQVKKIVDDYLKELEEKKNESKI